MMERAIVDKRVLRHDKENWCELHVQIRQSDKGPELSITGSEGQIISRTAARKMALAYWENFFEDSPNERILMGEKFAKHFRTASSAARFVVKVDGEFHGLDVHQIEGGKVFITQSCGQIGDVLENWFPEAKPYRKWHLNNLHAECEHQEARGETYETHPGARCPDCGYKIGSAWKARKLPAEVIKWAKELK
jgi:hypothetical protein